MKKTFSILATTLILSSATFAKTFTVGSGKWTDAKVWNNDYPGNVIKANDEVIITGQVTMNTSIVVEGSLKVEKGAGMQGMKDLVVAKGGKFINNGNTVMNRIVNEGSINNNLIMEAMTDIDNKGDMINNNNVVAGNNFDNMGGNADGKNGAYYANNNVITSPSSKIGGDVKVFHGNSLEEQMTAKAPALNLEASIQKNAVVLNVVNPSKVNVSLFSIEKSSDGTHFNVIGVVGNHVKDGEPAMSYTDKSVNGNLIYYRVKAVNTNGQETVLPVAAVKSPMNNALTMAY